MDAIHVLKRPLLTEKGAAQGEHGHYLFEVSVTARKDAIKRAVEELYGVHVVSVNTMVRKGAKRRTRYGVVPGKTTKKAVVRLKEGETIELF